jgi:hypothetical protein
MVRDATRVNTLISALIAGRLSKHILRRIMHSAPTQFASFVRISLGEAKAIRPLTSQIE